MIACLELELIEELQQPQQPQQPQPLPVEELKEEPLPQEILQQSFGPAADVSMRSVSSVQNLKWQLDYAHDQIGEMRQVIAKMEQ